MVAAQKTHRLNFNAEIWWMMRAAKVVGYTTQTQYVFGDIIITIIDIILSTNWFY